MDAARLTELRARLGAALGGQFEVGELLGTGAFAAVFRARDPLLGRDVAVKVFDPELSLGHATADGLLDEARLVATIEHPHIVPLYEAGVRDGLVFLVMRCFPDGTAAARLRREGAWSPRHVAQLGAEVAGALAAAHARGVVHLDVKPENILLDAHGHAAVSDFGIARAIANAGPSPDGRVSGTPHYMSPEQVAGDRLDGRTDVYALGVVLYELVTGTLPVSGDSTARVMANVIRQQPADVSRVVPELPAALGRVISRALRKDPAERWASAGEMAEALRAAGSADQLIAPSVARRRERRRWYLRVALVVGGIALGIGLVATLVYRVLSAFGTGAPPTIDARAPMIPPALLDSARGFGAIADGDSVRYLFAPHGKGMADAFLVTAADMVVLRAGVPRRYSSARDYMVEIRRAGDEGFLLIRFPQSKQVDTIYRDMSGLEQQILGLALRQALTDR